MLGVAPRNRENLGFLPPRPSLNSLKSSSRGRKVSESVLCSQSLRCLREVFECKVRRAAARSLHRSMDQNEHLSRSQTVQRNGWTIFLLLYRYTVDRCEPVSILFLSMYRAVLAK